ncbi:MAG: cupin domain-containing protein [Xanthobacteraceae bacterium]|nr:cupin domain-containing protein [Xanthobacteraceae bacterium]
MIKSGNLFAGMPGTLAAEQITALLTAPNVRIERIVSHGQASPPGFWYDQPQAEWVIVLAGSAAIAFEGEAPPRTLRSGDHLHIPAHTRHRVEWTDVSEPTVWLAVHYR